MSTPNAEESRPMNEIRIGLVLYGGVSLAIYIYGVVLEFLRVVRAWEEEKDDPDNVYAGILKNTRSKVVVDIISGTSAGGINRVLLAKALANGLSSYDFGTLRSLWLEAAELQSLLKPGRSQMAALLDEEFFEKQLLQALRQMDSMAKPSSPSVNALDLYVSSTDLHGRIVSSAELGVTAFGKPIESREYRRMFHLRFRKKAYIESEQELGSDKNEFTEDENQTLLDICRATSAFPVALRPVTLKKGETGGGKLLKQDDNPTVFLTDGGVLNNKPFSDTITAIFRRDPLGKVDRLLFYVEPDPETYVEKDNKTDREEPGFWEVITKSTVGIPSYQSITNDIRNVRDRNKRIAEFNEILKNTERVIKEAPVTKLDRDEDYRSFLENQALFKGYQELKLSQLNARLQELFLECGLCFDDLNSDTAMRVKTVFKNAFERLRTQNNVQSLLGTFDSPYRIRRLFRLVEITEMLYDIGGADWRKIDEFMKKISELLELNRDIERRTWNSSGQQPRGWFEEPLNKLKQEIMSLKDKLNEELLADEILALLKGMMAYVSQDGKGPKQEYAKLKERGRVLARELDVFRATLELPKDHALAGFPPFEKVFTQFEFRDMFIHPMEVIGGLGERDPIEIVRISPKDATHISSDSAKKLAGDTLFHFGGFLKKQWRENDIMWGRLDAAELIVRTLCRKGSGELDEKETLDRVMKDILATDNKESEKAVKPGVDYRRYMREEYDIGSESLKDLDTGIRCRLILNIILSLRDMLRYDLKYGGGRKNKLIGFLDRRLGQVLHLISVPVGVSVRALFDKDSLVQTLFSFFILALGIWGGITLALFILGRVLSLTWLKVDLILAGIALAAVLVSALFGCLLMKYRRVKRAR